MIEQPKTQGQDPRSGKLVLPSYSDEERSSSQAGFMVRPEHLIRQGVDQTPKKPLARLGYFWRKDPAYKVLIMAAAMVLISSLVFAFLAAAFVQNPDFWASSNGIPQKPPTSVTPASTVDSNPTFPAPAGGSGSSTSSQPPTQQTPSLQPTPGDTPTAEASPTQGPGGNLTVQITSIPDSVSNNSVGTVTVNASEPGANVRLEVFYNVFPYQYQSKSQVADGDGNATLGWRVQVYKRGSNNVVARVVSIATDDAGQQADSAEATVQVN